jgi:hypothetical protein
MDLASAVMLYVVVLSVVASWTLAILYSVVS